LSSFSGLEMPKSTTESAQECLALLVATPLPNVGYVSLVIQQKQLPDSGMAPRYHVEFVA
jgi:hypothetical protein